MSRDDAVREFSLKRKIDSLEAGTSVPSHTHAISDVIGLDTTLDAKQSTLVSATNIKTVNGSSLLGSGDLVVSGGGGSPILAWMI